MHRRATTGVFLVDPFLQFLVVVKGALFAKFSSDRTATGVFFFLSSAEPTTKPALLARLLGTLFSCNTSQISK